MHFLLLGLQAVVLCQVEKAKEDMLNQLYSSVRFRNLLFPSIFILLCWITLFAFVTCQSHS